jgi:N-carbamoylputrescine amidase
VNLGHAAQGNPAGEGEDPDVSRVRPPLRLIRTPAVAAVSAPFASDVQAGLAQVARTVRSARERGAGLVVFPEAALGGYMREEQVGVTVRRSSPAVLEQRDAVFARLARIAGPTVVCIGYTESAPGGPDEIFSSAVCISGDGVLGHHRKVHIPPGEHGVYTAGDGFAAFDTPVGRVGMLICYDKVFPEAARALALDRAEIVACMAAWPVCRLRPARLMRNDRQVKHFNALDVARAVENQVVWVSSNLYGSLGRLRFPGQAKVVDPDGRVLSSTGARAGMALARIDIRAAVQAARGELSHLGDRVPVAYGMSVAPRASAA